MGGARRTEKQTQDACEIRGRKKRRYAFDGFLSQISYNFLLSAMFYSELYLCLVRPRTRRRDLVKALFVTRACRSLRCVCMRACACRPVSARLGAARQQVTQQLLQVPHVPWLGMLGMCPPPPPLSYHHHTETCLSPPRADHARTSHAPIHREKASSTLVESRAEVSMKERPFTSANGFGRANERERQTDGHTQEMGLERQASHTRTRTRAQSNHTYRQGWCGRPARRLWSRGPKSQ